MRCIPIFLSLTLLFSNCDDKPTTRDKGGVIADTTTMRIQVPNQSCYYYSNGRDTFHMKVERFPNVVTGELVYDFAEKDNNTGTFDGLLKGDTLIADYTYSSEGQQSTRQVAFLLQDSMVTEGYGEVVQLGDRQVFKNVDSLDFRNGVRMKAVPCKMLDQHP